jgi:hypothetical protein
MSTKLHALSSKHEPRVSINKTFKHQFRVPSVVKYSGDMDWAM